VNPARKTTEEPEKKSVDTLLPTAQFICPITMKEMNGKQRFCFMRPCGCVLSEQAVKEIVTGEKKCLHCQQVIYDFVPINPKGADLERLRLALAEKTRKLKKRKVDDLQAKETEVPTIAQDEQPAVKSSEEMQNDSIPKIISAKQSSAAIKSIYSSSSTGSAGKGNWLTKGTFTRYVA
jgi:hypothetical protein